MFDIGFTELLLIGLMALLVGVNAAPIITPWASLATLLWADQARRQGVQVRWRTFILLGLVIAPVAVVVGTGAIVVMSP